MVVGDGPAGCVAALLLARWGARVGLVADPAGEARRPAVGEVLPPAGRAALERLGLGRVLADAAHVPVPGSVALWGSDTPAARDHLRSPHGDALALDRARFLAALRDAAVAAGAGVVPLARGRWRELAPGTVAGLASRLVLDGSGRTASLARAAGARVVAEDRLVAVVGVLGPGRDTADTDRRVMVASAPDGWWSSTLLTDGRRIAAFHTDRDLVPPGARGDPDAWFERLRTVPVLGEGARAAGLTRPGALHVVAADSRRLRHAGVDGRAGRPTVLAAGDAEMAFDPLSSLGILAAVSSAEEAVVVAQALLDADGSATGESRAQAAAVARERARADRWRQYLERLGSVYAEEERWAERPFWARRRAATLVG